MNRLPPGMKTASQVEAESVPDFVTDGITNHCRHCGMIKDATSAKFFVDHYRECVEPRKREEEMAAKESGKTDAMRKAREEQWAARQSAARRALAIPTEPPSGVGTLDNETPEPRAPRKPATPARASGAQAPSEQRASTAASSSSTDVGKRQPAAGEVRCSGCGKIRAVRNGKIVAHLKGLRGQCPGAGKAA